MSRKTALHLALAAALSFFASPAMAAPVETESGRVEGVQEGALAVFKGIPYAAPPVGERRWRAPEPAPAWAGARNADACSPICPRIGAYPDDAPRGDPTGVQIGATPCLQDPASQGPARFFVLRRNMLKVRRAPGR